MFAFKFYHVPRNIARKTRIQLSTPGSVTKSTWPFPAVLMSSSGRTNVQPCNIENLAYIGSCRENNKILFRNKFDGRYAFLLLADYQCLSLGLCLFGVQHRWITSLKWVDIVICPKRLCIQQESSENTFDLDGIIVLNGYRKKNCKLNCRYFDVEVRHPECTRNLAPTVQ